MTILDRLFDQLRAFTRETQLLPDAAAEPASHPPFRFVVFVTGHQQKRASEIMEVFAG